MAAPAQDFSFEAPVIYRKYIYLCYLTNCDIFIMQRALFYPGKVIINGNMKYTFWSPRVVCLAGSGKEGLTWVWDTTRPEEYRDH